MELAEAAAEGRGGADGDEESAAGQRSAGKVRQGRETEDDLEDEVVTEVDYGGTIRTNGLEWYRRRQPPPPPQR